MSNKHVCLVPNEWGMNYYTPDVLEVIIKKEVTCAQITKKIEGIGIRVEGVTAHLRYNGQQPWMRKDNDEKSWPHPKEYFGVYMSCNDCREPVDNHMALCSMQGSIISNTGCHRHMYLVPREWLSLPWADLEYTIHKEISSYYSEFGKLEGVAIVVQNVIAILKYSGQKLWMCKVQDQRDKPHLTEYFAIFVPCLFCFEPNKPLYRRN